MVKCVTGCGASARLGLKSDGVKTHCSKCGDKSTMVDFYEYPCEFEDCIKNSSYAYEVEYSSEEDDDIIVSLGIEPGEDPNDYITKKEQKALKLAKSLKKTKYAAQRRLPSGKPMPLRCATHGKLVGMICVTEKLCEFKNPKCKNKATYGNGKKTFCKEHAGELPKIKRGLCNFPCPKYASYGYPDTRKPLRCIQHILPEMEDVKSQRCVTCNLTRASFNLEGLPAKYCVNCATPEMLGVNNKKCITEGCTTQPSFNYDGGKPLFCGKCKLDEMINVRGNRCDGVTNDKKCGRQALYGNEYEKPSKCSDHKTDNMVRIYKPLCSFELGCDIEPSYGFPGGRFERCSAHREKGMITRNKLCQYEGGCNVIARYGFFGERSLRCKEHILPGMITKKVCCIEENCLNSASYGIDKKLYCKKHMDPATMKDLTNLYCKFPDCTSRAKCGLPGNQSTMCIKHAEKGMILRPNPNCTTKGCGGIAIYGKDNSMERCELCKYEDDENLVEKPCVSCHIDAILDNNDMCFVCVKNTESPIRLRKQNALMNYLDAFGHVGVSTDRRVPDSCNREKPDRIFYFGHKVVIIECDENQHRNYPEFCEKIRMRNISQDFGEQPVYFIRFNPDKYLPDQSRKLSVQPINVRYDLLKQLLDGIRDEKIVLPHEKCSALYMYYDGWDGDMNNWVFLDKYEK